MEIGPESIGLVLIISWRTVYQTAMAPQFNTVIGEIDKFEMISKILSEAIYIHSSESF